MNDGKQRKLRRGLHITGNTPYGYIITKDKQLVVSDTVAFGDMTEADVVRLIFEKTISENMGANRMAGYLNSLGLTRQGNPWKYSAILNILKNPKYKGVATYNVRSRFYSTFDIEVPPIVDADTWAKANDGRKIRQRFNRQRDNPHRYLLSGLVRCGLCGYAYTGVYFDKPAMLIKRLYVCHGKRSRSTIDWGGTGAVYQGQARPCRLAGGDCLGRVPAPFA
jgi:site-specific DNA recombinase